MTTNPDAPAGEPQEASAKHIVVDGRFAALLEEDFGIEWATVVEALIGEPYKQAIQLCQWAERRDEPAKALLAWSRKHRKGTHRPRRRSCRRYSDAPTDTSPERGGNRPAPADTTTPRRSDTVTPARRDESLRGVLVHPDRLAETAEKLGV